MRTAIFFDTETTGFNKKRTDRLVQIAWLLVDLSENSELNRGSYIIKPDGFDIPYKAAAIHKIDTNLARRMGQPLSEVLNLFSADLSKADLVIGHNIQFDIKIIKDEFSRCKISFELLEKPSVCTMRLSKTWCRIPNFSGKKGFKWPKLQELHFKLYGKNFDDAHDALEDILATKRCFDKLVKLGVIVIPKVAVDLHKNLEREPSSIREKISDTGHVEPTKVVLDDTQKLLITDRNYEPISILDDETNMTIKGYREDSTKTKLREKKDRIFVQKTWNILFGCAIGLFFGAVIGSDYGIAVGILVFTTLLILSYVLGPKGENKD